MILYNVRGESTAVPVDSESLNVAFTCVEE